MSDEARNGGWLPILRENYKGGFPDATGRLTKLLEDPDTRQTIMDQLKNGFLEKVSEARQWGKDLIDNFISGLVEKGQALINTVSGVAGAVKSFLGFSEPEMGPLSDFHTYAPDMMDLFIQGIRDKEGALQAQIGKTFALSDTIGAAAAEKSAPRYVNEDSSITEQLAEYLPYLAYLPKLANMQMVMDTDSVVGELTPSFDSQLGILQGRKYREGFALG